MLLTIFFLGNGMKYFLKVEVHNIYAQIIFHVAEPWFISITDVGKVNVLGFQRTFTHWIVRADNDS